MVQLLTIFGLMAGIASALEPALPYRAGDIIPRSFPGSQLFARQAGRCAAGSTPCGSRCSLIGDTCCPAASAGCEPGTYCVPGGCCPNGQVCSGGGGIITIIGGGDITSTSTITPAPSTILSTSYYSTGYTLIDTTTYYYTYSYSAGITYYYTYYYTFFSGTSYTYYLSAGNTFSTAYAAASTTTSASGYTTTTSPTPTSPTPTSPTPTSPTPVATTPLTTLPTTGGAVTSTASVSLFTGAANRDHVAGVVGIGGVLAWLVALMV